MKKPTIKELEKILDEPSEIIIILPDGSIKTTKDEDAKNAKAEILSIEEALKLITTEYLLMTLTNDQCIQVVEKIWGWQSHQTGVYFMPTGSVSVQALSPDELKNKVNSWQGFGRTVQRMRGHPNYGEFSVKCSIYLNGYLAEMTGVNYMFEATHLAALEVVREEK